MASGMVIVILLLLPLILIQDLTDRQELGRVSLALDSFRFSRLLLAIFLGILLSPEYGVTARPSFHDFLVHRGTS